MSELIRDLFKTRQPDGSYLWDITNPAFSAVPWILGVLTYIALGIFKGVQRPDAFSLMDYATGLAATFAGGGIGVMFHSKAQN